MAVRDLFGFWVEIDEEATRAWYAQADEWGCECGDCRNFLTLARRRALPAPVLELLDKLGIPPEKATYVCEMYPAEGGHVYQFSWRIAGNILGGGEKSGNSQGWGEASCLHEPYPYGAPGFPKPHFDLNFFIELPWALDEPRE